MTQVSDDFEEDVLFSLLPVGGQPDGLVTADVGWACFTLAETVGIEAIVGLSGFDSADHFKLWAENTIGAALPDWEPCEVLLYQCWIPYPDEQLPHLRTQAIGATEDRLGDEQFSYVAWRAMPDADAIKVVPTPVFAIRHRAYLLAQQRSNTAFQCARQRSYAEAAWIKTHPGERITPAIMETFTDTGFYLSGISGGRDVPLTWPSDDLPSTLMEVASLKLNGVQNICLCEGELGFPLDELTEGQYQKLLEAFQHYGAEMPLIDLASAAGFLNS